MIVIETSAIIAIYRREPDYVDYVDAIARAESASVPASCFVESVMVLARHASGTSDLKRFLDDHEISMAPVNSNVAKVAAEAFLRFGKGRGHRAQLNFGDCLSYAVAKHLDAPLLYKGNDFVHTDVRNALAR